MTDIYLEFAKLNLTALISTHKKPWIFNENILAKNNYQK
jgi:hypothetical protein